VRPRSLVLALVTSLTLIPLGSANAAPTVKTIKVGSTCKKVGTTTKVGSATFTCTKSGSKLIWTNKVIKSKPVPAPSTAPTIAPTPTPSPSNSIAPTPTPSPTQTSQTIIRNNGPKTEAGRAAAEPIYKILNQVSAELYQRSLLVKKANATIYSDEPNNSLVEVTRVNVNRTIEMMRAIVPDFPDNEVYLFRKMSWLEQSNIKDLCPNLIRDQKSYGWANAGCNKYWVGSFDDYENPNTYNGKQRHSARSLLGFTGAHETVHLIQSGNQNGNWDKFPAWYREGSATVGAGLVMVSLTDFANGDYSALDDWENNSWSKPRCKAVFDNWKVKNEASGHGLTKNCEYSVGRRMIEYLVAKDKTFDNIRKVYDAVGPNMSFNEAFKKYHGIELSQFFTEIEAWLEQLDWAVAETY